MNRILASLALTVFGAAAQDVPPVGTVSNSLTLFQENLGSRQLLMTVTVAVTYPDNLEEAKYIDVLTIAQDVQGFLRGYSNRQAALEVFAAHGATALMSKYPQLSAVSVVLTATASNIQVTATRAIPNASTAVRTAMRDELERALKRARN